MKPTLKAPGTKRLKLKYVKLLSICAFNFDLCRCVNNPPVDPGLTAIGFSA